MYGGEANPVFCPGSSRGMSVGLKSRRVWFDSTAGHSLIRDRLMAGWRVLTPLMLVRPQLPELRSRLNGRPALFESAREGSSPSFATRVERGWLRASFGNWRPLVRIQPS